MKKLYSSILLVVLVFFSAMTLHAQTPLYDNGPLVTHPGGGYGGADASVLNTSANLSTLGFGHQVIAGNRVADDFTVTAAGGWQIDGIIFYAYQTGDVTDTSTITAVNYQIWDGPPNDPASTVIYGDTTTNRLTSSYWSNIYRVIDTDMLGTTRRIMRNNVSADVHLAQGTYWLDWQTDGLLSSGPWVPPITIWGQGATGNALQYTSASGVWNTATDSGSDDPQGLPFILLTAGITPTTFVLTATITGTGSGTLDAYGLTCNGNACTGTYSDGDVVTVTATAGSDSVLAGWTGCESVADNVCSVTITGDLSITAIFDKVIAINDDASCTPRRLVTINLTAPGHGADQMCLKRDGKPLCDPDSNQGWIKYEPTKKRRIVVPRGEAETFHVLFRQGGKGGETAGPFSASILLANSRKGGCLAGSSSKMSNAARAAYIEEGLKAQAFEIVE